MKILLASSSGIYDASFPELTKNQSGFGYMIRSLSDMLAMEGDEVDIITQSNITRGRKIGGSTLLRKRLYDIVLGASPFYMSRGIKVATIKGLSLGTRLRILMYFATGRYMERILKRKKYDVVHINGVGHSALPLMYACARTNTPFALTLHGLISFNESVKTTKFSKLMERVYFIKNGDNDNSFSTVISTGIKRDLADAVGLPLEGMSVVCNPVIPAPMPDGAVYTKAEGERVIVCIGNVNENKNQKMVVDAFSLLMSHRGEGYKLIIIGGGEWESLRDYAGEQGIGNVVFTGPVSKSEVNGYLSVADLNVCASFTEGFGMPIAEGFALGVPCILPATVHAYPDLAAPETAVAVEGYTPEQFAFAMERALDKAWDKKKIIEFSGEFTERSCAHKYLTVLRRAAERGVCHLTVDLLDEMLKDCIHNPSNIEVR